jgi:hypothetical protein
MWPVVLGASSVRPRPLRLVKIATPNASAATPPAMSAMPFVVSVPEPKWMPCVAPTISAPKPTVKASPADHVRRHQPAPGVMREERVHGRETRGTKATSTCQAGRVSRSWKRTIPRITLTIGFATETAAMAGAS